MTSVDDGRDGAFQVTAGSGRFRAARRRLQAQRRGLRHAAAACSSTLRRERRWLARRLARRHRTASSASPIRASRASTACPARRRRGERRPHRLVQDKILSKGEWRPTGQRHRGDPLLVRRSDYAHNELDFTGVDFEVGSRFTNRETEGAHRGAAPPVDDRARRADRRGRRAVRTTATSRARASRATRCSIRRARESAAAFWFEELQATQEAAPAGGLPLRAARRVDGTGLADVSDPRRPFWSTASGTFAPMSGEPRSALRSAVRHVARLSGQYVERAPDAAELFSKGAHEATGTFEIGNPDPREGAAATVELGFKRASGDAALRCVRLLHGLRRLHLQGSSPAWSAVARFAIDCGAPGGDETFDQLLFQQKRRDVLRRRASRRSSTSARVWNGVWGVEGAVRLRARQVRRRRERAAHAAAPARRRPLLPRRAWIARASLLHAFDQDEIAAQRDARPRLHARSTPS